MAEAVTPLAQLIAPPLDELVTTPVPVVPCANVVADEPLSQSTPILKPPDKAAVPDVPMPSKFSVNAVLNAEITSTALIADGASPPSGAGALIGSAV